MTAPKKRNLAARMALWSAHHRKKAIFGWLAFVIVIFAISKFAVTQQTLVYETSGPVNPDGRTPSCTTTSSSRRARTS